MTEGPASDRRPDAVLRPSSEVPAAPRPGLPKLDAGIIEKVFSDREEQLAVSEGSLRALEQNPSDRDAVSAALGCFHCVNGLAASLHLGELQSLAHAAGALLGRVRSDQLVLTSDVSRLISEAAGVLRRMLCAVRDRRAAGVWPPTPDPLVPPLVARIQSLLNRDPPAQAAARGDASDDGARDNESRPTRAMGGAERTIRVDADRLDLLGDLVGELVISQSMVQRASLLGDAGLRDLRRHMLRLDKITRELQELAGSLRLVPVQGLFRRMARLARDVAKKAGKRVCLEMAGEETELDKTIVEKISDPLVHLLRNAVDHGLEHDPEERIRRGKPEVGRVWLRASHKGASIQIEVEDDGRGLNRDAIVEKARQRGLLEDKETVSDEDVFALICEPGFSTADQVTELSGRGVGMDVVKRNINAMGGVLHINSEATRGTRFTMKLPLTLAVIDGMLVRAGAERYVIPTLSIVKLVEPRATELAGVLDRQELLEVQGQMIPMLRLTTLFGFAPSRSDARLAIVTEAEGSRVAILVDELLGQQQAVVKSLGHGIAETPGVAGCAILSDGRVGLVLDIGGLLRLARSRPGGGPMAVAAADPAGRSGDSAWMS